MKAIVENIYGIIGERLVFDSKDKKNMVVFAPNGIGKTSLVKGIKNFSNEEPYQGMENKRPFISLEFKNKKYTYDFNKQNSQGLNKSNIGFISEENNSTNLSEIESILQYDNFREEVLNYEKISLFFKKIKEEYNDDVYLLEIESTNKSDEIISFLNEQLEGEPLGNLENVKKEISKNLVALEQTKKVQETCKNIKRIDEYANAYDNSSPKETSVEKLLDVKIIRDIMEQKKEKSNDFGYKIKDEYTPILEINEKWIEEMSKSYSEEEIKFIILIPTIKSLIKKKVNGEYKQTKINPFIKDLSKNIIKLKKSKFNLIVRKYANEFEKLKKEYDVATKKTIKKINDEISKINLFFKKDTLDWKIKISKIDSIVDKINIQILFDESPKEWTSFDEYASSGQKRVLQLIISLTEFYEKNGVVIIDDAFNSLDNHHINEVLEVINDKSFKGIDFLIMSHNFEWLRSLSFHEEISKETEFIVLDKITNEKFTLINIDKDDLKHIASPKNFNFKRTNSIEKVVILSNIAREVLDNYLLTNESISFEETNVNRKQEHSNYLKDGFDEIKKAISFFDQKMRHYKGNITIENLSSYFNESIATSLLKLPIINEIKIEIKKLLNNDKNQVFGNLVVAKENKWDNAKSFSEYIGNKIFFGTNARFKIELKKFYSNDDEQTLKARQKWESQNKWQKANSMLSKELRSISSYKLNYLSHVNNIQ